MRKLQLKQLVCKLLCTSVVTGTVIMHVHARVYVTDTSEMAASHVCHFANTNFA